MLNRRRLTGLSSVPRGGGGSCGRRLLMVDERRRLAPVLSAQADGFVQTRNSGCYASSAAIKPLRVMVAEADRRRRWSRARRGP